MRTLRVVLWVWLACFNAPALSTAQAPPDPPAVADKPHPDSGDEQTHKGFDAEADYLALADSPIFLPRSYLYWGTPVGSEEQREPLVFALEYALHLSIYNDVRDKALAGSRWAGAATLSFEGDLRMLSTTSKPVRMPSYRPNLSGQLFYIIQRAQPMLLGLRLGVYHYSNGQEHCTFDRELSDESDACRTATAQVTNAAAALNRIDGNFSTNGWLLQFDYRAHQVNSKGVAIAHIAAGASVYGMIDQGPGAMEAALRRLYGWGRLQGNVEGKKRFGWATMTVRSAVNYFPHTSGRTPSTSGSVELVVGPYWLTGIGFFARYYGGRDFYNAFFVDRIEQFAAGVAWDGERPLKFKTPEQGTP